MCGFPDSVLVAASRVKHGECIQTGTLLQTIDELVYAHGQPPRSASGSALRHASRRDECAESAGCGADCTRVPPGAKIRHFAGGAETGNFAGASSAASTTLCRDTNHCIDAYAYS